MANRYWVGGAGNWSDASNHWASSSGGAPNGANIPSTSDNAFFDGSSGITSGDTINADTACQCNDITTTVGTNWTLGSAELLINGSIAFEAGLTCSSPLELEGSATGKTLTFNGCTLTGTVAINGNSSVTTGGGWILNDALVTSSTFTIGNGSFDANDQNITATEIYLKNNDAATASTIVTMGSGTWECTNGIFSFDDTYGPTPEDPKDGITVTCETSTVKLTPSGGTGSFGNYGVDKTFYKLWFDPSATTTFTMGGSSTFNELKNTTGVEMSLNFEAEAVTTVTTWNIRGSSGYPITVQADFGSFWEPTHFRKNSGVVISQYLILKNAYADNFLIDQKQLIVDETEKFGYTADHEKVAQSFTPSTTADIHSILVYLEDVGSPTDFVTMKIYSDSGGAPNTLLATSSHTNSTLWYFGYFKFNFAQGTTLTASTVYWIELSRTGSLSTTDYYQFYRSSTGGYAGGSALKHNGTSWAADTGDWYFKQYYYSAGATWYAGATSTQLETSQDEYDSSWGDSFKNIDNTGGGGHYYAVGQSILGAGKALTSVSFDLKKAGSPTGNCNVVIYAHSGTFGTSSVGTGSVLATSDNLDVSTLTTSVATYNFTFSGANLLTLTRNTAYVIAVTYPGGSGSDYVQIAIDSSSGTHMGNETELSGSWSANATHDTCFFAYTYNNDNWIFTDLISPQTITGKARITATTTKTITGVASIDAGITTTDKTITGTSRIELTTTKTITGLSRIGLITDKTITGLARITANATNTISGVSRVGLVTNQTVSGVSRIQLTTTKTITGVARVTANTTKTETGIARITANATNTIDGLARISLVTTQTIAGVSRITTQPNQTISGISRITANTTKTESGVSRITANASSTIAGVSRITANTTKTISGVSRVGLVTSKTITGTSRIQTTATKTISGVSRIAFITSKLLTGLSRITANATKTISGVARIQKTTTNTITGVSRVTVTQSTTISGVSRITKYVDATESGVARITANTAQTITGTSAVAIPATTQDITGTSRITTQAPQTITGTSKIKTLTWHRANSPAWETKPDTTWQQQNSPTWKTSNQTDWYEPDINI